MAPTPPLPPLSVATPALVALCSVGNDWSVATLLPFKQSRHRRHHCHCVKGIRVILQVCGTLAVHPAKEARHSLF